MQPRYTSIKSHNSSYFRMSQCYNGLSSRSKSEQPRRRPFVGDGTVFRQEFVQLQSWDFHEHFHKAPELSPATFDHFKRCFDV